METKLSVDTTEVSPNSSEPFSEEDIKLGIEVVLLLLKWKQELENNKIYQEEAA